MNLFSVFDPVVGGVQLNWVILFMMVLMLPGVYSLGGGKWVVEVWNSTGGVFAEVSGGRGEGVKWVAGGLFFYLVLNNWLGLLPFIFTATAHPVMSLGVGVVVWSSFFLMGWVKRMRGSAAHLVPQGSPLVLSFVLVVIEFISHMMRPFTLSIRLAANMMAGHLIMGLLASISLMGAGSFVISFFLQSVMMVLEWGVAVIQGVVFGILVVLYALDYYCE